LPGLIERAGLDVTACQAGQRLDVGAVLGENLGKELCGTGGIAVDKSRLGGFEQVLGLAADPILGEPPGRRPPGSPAMPP